MKVETDLKAGGYLVQVQDQAEKFFQDTDQVLQNVSNQLDAAVTATASKLGRVWNCAWRA